jgi:hypothetical protein
VLTVGSVSYGVSLDAMSNRIKIAFTDELGVRGTTGWGEDADSIATFGKKELLVSMTNVSEGAALARRDSALMGDKRISRPRGVSSGEGGNAGAGLAKVELRCNGWFRSLDWRLYADTRGLEQYDDNGAGTQDLGESVQDYNRVAQSFALPTGSPTWYADRIGLWVYKIGNPTDDIIVDIKSGNTFGSGSVLATATYPNAALTDNSQKKVVALLSAPVLMDDTPRHIEIRRSGANHATNYWRVNYNDQLGYSRGTMRVKKVATWQAPAPDGDMLFYLYGPIQTTELIRQVVDVVANPLAAGQFFSGVDIETASGVYTNQNHDGDDLAGDIVDEMIKAGTASGDWLLADVTPSRRLRIYRAPNPAEAQWYLDTRHQLHDQHGSPMMPRQAQPGVWARLRDVFPSLEFSALLAAGNNELIDRVEYTADYDDAGRLTGERVRYTPRNARHPLDIGAGGIGQ